MIWEQTVVCTFHGSEYVSTHSKANHSLNTWTKITVGDYSLYVPRHTVLFVICLMCHLCILSTMAMQVFMLSPYQEAKHQTIACCYLFPWLDMDYWPKDCNYRPSMVHWNCGEEKKQGGKYQWLQKNCRITSPFLRWNCCCRMNKSSPM